MNQEIKTIEELVKTSNRLVIIQADNPDADSLCSALALESILGDMGKETFMYCALDMPDYLKYLSGWDRVEKEIPANFDLSIIVDTSTKTLLEKLESSAQITWLNKHPCIVLDHHAGVKCDIAYATVVINDPSKVSTGELIYSISKGLGWEMSLAAKEFITNSILADSLGLVSENTTSDTYRTIADLIDSGVSRPKLEELRRSVNKMVPEIFRYKGELIERTELLLDGRLAYLTIPQAEINKYSPLYNPGPLIQGDHLQTSSVLISVVLKSYDNGRITATIRSNNGANIASELAENFGGGGHAYAAGFKTEGQSVIDIKKKLVSKVSELLEKSQDKQ